MIQELLEKHKEKMCSESRTYRMRRSAYRELIELFCQETAMRGPFQRYLALLERDRQRQYQRDYDWGFALGCGEKIEIDGGREVPPGVEELQQAKKEMEDRAKWDSEETFALWKLFCGLERRCRAYEAAYLTAQGVEAGERYRKNGILPE